jgi:signal transduction histidine kinase
MTDTAYEPVATTEDAPREPPTRGSDNPLVRAVERITLPLRAKLLIGFAVVGALLALLIALGLVALGQSNSRGEELRKLQQRAVYVQVVLTDATQLEKAIDFRLNSPGSTTTFGSGLDQSITNIMNDLCIDSGLGGCMGPGVAGPFKLASIDPAAIRMITRNFGTFYAIAGQTGVPPIGGIPITAVKRILAHATVFAFSLSANLKRLARETSARTDALVAANRSSFDSSRNLLIGAGAGSLALALALALVLSSSVVGPLRRTEGRLAEIGAGDFSGRLEVANRDEIGKLAARVNSTSDELQHVYRELEVASQHKSDFLATMSHELRTPLNAIIGFSEVLHERMFGELNERQAEYVGDVLEAGRHLLSLINDVLDLSKVEAGRMELVLSQVSLSATLRSGLTMHAERASRGGVALELELDQEELVVEADERKLRQVVFNLLSNAVKFTPPGGRVDVTAGLSDGVVEVAVADTGFGIAPGDRNLIFDEFQQARGTQDGTGLGLPIARKFIELHGGRLWVESTPGSGSTFRFTMPVKQPVVTP